MDRLLYLHLARVYLVSIPAVAVSQVLPPGSQGPRVGWRLYSEMRHDVTGQVGLVLRQQRDCGVHHKEETWPGLGRVHGELPGQSPLLS